MAAKQDIQILAELSEIQAKACGDRPAWVLGDRVTSYESFDGLANQVANAFAAEGVKPQARVAQIGKNSDFYYEMLFGAAKAGCVLVPVNWRLAPPEISYIINDAGAELLFVGKDFVDVIEGLLDQMPSVKKIIAIDGGHGAWPDYSAWRDAQKATKPTVKLNPKDVVVQMYTSGTTGHPKGAQLSNLNVCTQLQVGSDGIGHWTDDDVSLVVMPQFHIAGTAWGVFGFYAGAKNVIMEDVVLEEILTTIERERVTKMFVVPAVILFLIMTPETKETDFSSLGLIVYGASPITQGLLRQALDMFACDFAQVYGLTETSGAITYLAPEEHTSGNEKLLLSCGKPLGTVELKIVGEDGKEMPTGEIGEVACRTPLNMIGYWNLPDATKASIRGGWFYTGDAGYMDDEGYLYMHDRVKDMIISGGENIYPAEVESALSEHPAVADVGVIGVPDEEWGEAVKAMVVKAADQEVEEAELIAFARERIAGYKVPKSIDFVEALPRNPSGKILKREMREPFWKGHERQVS